MTHNNTIDLIKILKGEHMLPKSLNVVKVVTSYYRKGNNGLRIQKDVYTLKRKTFGWDILNEEIMSTEGEYIWKQLYQLEDGLYECYVCNVSKDWETGIVDDWDIGFRRIEDD